ncbi:MAG: hypothetical protein C0518_06495 [Opitutus sp.]|nr:hypothetical protein [Opitutus sp.]
MRAAPASFAQTGLAIEIGPAVFNPGLPVLGGCAVENLFGAVHEIEAHGSIRLFRGDDWLLGAAAVEVTPTTLEASAHSLYAQLCAVTSGRHLARIWNYVPDINGTGVGGLENYRAFCRGRSLAFERAHGAGFSQLLPSASAVGCQDGRLTIAFAASAVPPQHYENPLQVPAYHYPEQYGPRPPSFARATGVPRAGREPAVFISGTAAIRGHATMAPESTADQLACTLENLRAISRVCGLGENLAAGVRTRHFKVYLRHAEDYAAMAAALAEELFTAHDHVSYVRAEICRASLKVEIEATLL